MSEDQSLAETGEPKQSAALTADQTIVDTVLDLDEALSGDVRRAERTARFCIKPWLEADLDALEAELADLVDERGNALDVEDKDESLAAGPRRGVEQVMAEYREKHDEFVAAMRTVRVSAMEPSPWQAFREKNKRNIAENTLTPAMIRELVTTCSIRPTIPAMKYDELLARYGTPAMFAIGKAAWEASEKSGVDVPKSRVFSAVQRQRELSLS